MKQIDRERILRAANEYLTAPPITITASSSPRSKGGKHDYFSEADYWWPDPKNPGGPYIERDGYSDPQNFNDHRLALIRLSLIVPALTAAWLITQDKRYAEHAAVHLRAWFLAPETRMNPSLDYAQAVWGHSPGRSYGIIDTLHLVEVTRAARHLEAAQAMTTAESAGVREWFTEYLLWMRASTNGQEEEAAKNNHGNLLGGAGGGVRGLYRQRERDVAVPRAIPRSSFARSDGGRREFSAGAEAQQAVQLLALRSRYAGDGVRDCVGIRHGAERRDEQSVAVRVA